MKPDNSNSIIALAFLTPFLALFVVFMAYPLVSTLVLSFQSGGLISGRTFVGWQNYVEAFGNRTFIQSVVFTITYLIIIIPLVLFLALVLAVLLTQDRIAGNGTFRALLFLPNLMPMVTLAVLWTFMIHPEIGLINFSLRAIGINPPSWRGSQSGGLTSIVLIELWRGLGYYMIIFIAGLVTIPKELYEAARMDGATRLQLFLYVTLPALRPTILFCLVVATIFNLQVFDSIFVVTGGGPGGSTQSVVWYIFANAFKYDQIGRASAMATLLLIAICMLTFIQFRLFRK